MKHFCYLILFLIPKLALAQNNPILEANTLINTIDAQLKNKVFKETLNLSWQPAEFTSESADVLPNISFRYLAFPEGLGIQEIKFKGYESNFEIKYYCKANSPFYGFLISDVEGCSNRYKVYYERGQVLKCLRQTNDCMGTTMSAFSELKDEVTLEEELTVFNEMTGVAESYVDKYIFSLEEDAVVFPLRKEIKDIHSYAGLIAFVERHSPSFADLDSLFTILTHQPCPAGLTNSIVNGDPNTIQHLPKDYLHFVLRNCVQQLNYTLQSEKDLEQIPAFLDFQTSLKDYASKINISLAQNFERSYSNFSIDKLAFSDSKEMLDIPSNIKKWGIQLARNRVLYYPSIYAYDGDLVMYQMNKIYDEDADYDEEAEEAKQKLEDDFESKFCTDTYSKNLYRYLSAQVFGDIVFIYINNRWVFFDIDR